MLTLRLSAAYDRFSTADSRTPATFGPAPAGPNDRSLRAGCRRCDAGTRNDLAAPSVPLCFQLLDAWFRYRYAHSCHHGPSRLCAPTVAPMIAFVKSSISRGLARVKETRRHGGHGETGASIPVSLFRSEDARRQRMRYNRPWRRRAVVRQRYVRVIG